MKFRDIAFIAGALAAGVFGVGPATVAAQTAWGAYHGGGGGYYHGSWARMGQVRLDTLLVPVPALVCEFLG